MADQEQQNQAMINALSPADQAAMMPETFVNPLVQKKLSDYAKVLSIPGQVYNAQEPMTATDLIPQATSMALQFGFLGMPMSKPGSLGMAGGKMITPELKAEILKRQGDQSYGAIAEALGLSRNQVAGTLFRANNANKALIPSENSTSRNMLGTGRVPFTGNAAPENLFSRNGQPAKYTTDAERAAAHLDAQKKYLQSLKDYENKT